MSEPHGRPQHPHVTLEDGGQSRRGLTGHGLPRAQRHPRHPTTCATGSSPPPRTRATPRTRTPGRSPAPPTAPSASSATTSPTPTSPPSPAASCAGRRRQRPAGHARQHVPRPGTRDRVRVDAARRTGPRDPAHRLRLRGPRWERAHGVRAEALSRGGGPGRGGQPAPQPARSTACCRRTGRAPPPSPAPCSDLGHRRFGVLAGPARADDRRRPARRIPRRARRRRRPARPGERSSRGRSPATAATRR